MTENNIPTNTVFIAPPVKAYVTNVSSEIGFSRAINRIELTLILTPEDGKQFMDWMNKDLSAPVLITKEITNENH